MQAVNKQLAVRQAGEIVMHRIVQETLFSGALFSDIQQCADAADDLAIGPDDGPGTQPEPAEMAVFGSQPEGLDHLAAALIDHRIERGPEPVLSCGCRISSQSLAGPSSVPRFRLSRSSTSCPV